MYIALITTYEQTKWCAGYFSLVESNCVWKRFHVVFKDIWQNRLQNAQGKLEHFIHSNLQEVKLNPPPVHQDFSGEYQADGFVSSKELINIVGKALQLNI